MGKLAQRLSDSARSGVYRIETLEALEEAAELNSFRLVRVVLEHVTTKPALLDAVADAAAFPVRFGRNWNALPGCLTDLSWTPARGYVLLVSGFEALRRAAPEDFAGFLESLTAAAADWRDRGRPFFVVFLDPARAVSLAPLYNWDKRGK